MNINNMFHYGDIPTLEEVLNHREERVFKINSLLNQYQNTVVAFKLNIPGAVKNNDSIYHLFKYGLNQIEETEKAYHLNRIFSEEENLKTGPEIYIIYKNDSFAVKKAFIQLENNPLGPLYDADVYTLDKENITAVSRKDVNAAERKCLICNNYAKYCSGRRIHSLPELHEKIKQIIHEDLNYCNFTFKP